MILTMPRLVPKLRLLYRLTRTESFFNFYALHLASEMRLFLSNGMQIVSDLSLSVDLYCVLKTIEVVSRM